MDFSKVGSYFSELLHSAYCYFKPDAESCAAPQSAVQTDSYQQVELREIKLQELIQTHQELRVGCYIQIHRVPDFEAIRRQTPTTNPQK